MTAVRLARLLAISILFLICMSCGQNYRPVATPQSPNPPNPGFSHVAVVLSSNGINNPGAATTIDVSGDTAVSETNTGMSPAHMALVQNGTRVYVANRGDDSVVSFPVSTPSQPVTTSLPGTTVDITSVSQSGSTTTYSYNLISGSPLAIGSQIVISALTIPGNNGTFSITALGAGTFSVVNMSGVSANNQSGTGTVHSIPVFVASTQLSTVYVANAGTNTVSVINIFINVVTNTISVGTNPVAMAELPNGNRLYVANAGSGSTPGSLTSINTIDFSVNAPLSGVTWVTPAWIVARSDNQRVFVLDKGAGTVTEINTSGTTDAVLASVPVGVGADYMIYDANLSRLYVTNPVSGTVYVLDASDSAAGGAVSQLAAIPVPGAVSVAALPDKSRFYVASAVVSGTPAKVSSSVTVINTLSFEVDKTIALTSVAQTCPSFMNTPYALSLAASGDSTRVYAGNCDAESTAIIATVANSAPGSGAAQDTLVLNLAAPLSAQSPGNGGTPPPQNPVLVVTGP